MTIEIIVPSDELIAYERKIPESFRIGYCCCPTNHSRKRIPCVRIFFDDLWDSLLCPSKSEVYGRNVMKVGIKEIGDNILI